MIDLDLEDIYVSSHYTFFNEEMETLPKHKLQALQLQGLQAIVERAYTHNQFYHQLYDEAGVRPSDIKSLEDIRKLPFLEKKTVRAAYPYGAALVTPGSAGRALEVHATSGTTGKSVPADTERKVQGPPGAASEGGEKSRTSCPG